MKGSPVVVVGSINLDTVHEVDHLPAPGETREAITVRRNIGGKGANQAVAAARAGGAVSFVARVGSDDVGPRLRSGVAEFGIDVSGVRVVSSVRSGSAFITVDDRGENMIVIDAGANGAWTQGLGLDHDLVAAAPIVVVQQEIPLQVVEAVATASSGRLILNAAPARALEDSVLARCDPLVVNETELALVSGAAGIDEGLRLMIGRGTPSVVVTLGARGARWAASTASVDGAGAGEVSARSVAVADSTGAGDALVGVLAARLATEESLAAALPWAAAAATLSVRVAGTHASYPTLEDIAAELER